MAEPSLWRAVIQQALDDATRQIPPRDRNPKGTAREIADARTWFGSRDFEAVCLMAEMNVEVVRAYARRLISLDVTDNVVS